MHAQALFLIINTKNHLLIKFEPSGLQVVFNDFRAKKMYLKAYLLENLRPCEHHEENEE